MFMVAFQPSTSLRLLILELHELLASRLSAPILLALLVPRSSASPLLRLRASRQEDLNWLLGRLSGPLRRMLGMLDGLLSRLWGRLGGLLQSWGSLKLASNEVLVSQG
jgi:hypothetical protein